MKQIKNAIENLISDPRKEDRRIERLQSDVERLAASVDNLSYQLQEQSDYISESTRDLNVFLERRKCISFANKKKMFITVK